MCSIILIWTFSRKIISFINFVPKVCKMPSCSMWKVNHFSMEGIWKGCLFCQKWYGGPPKRGKGPWGETFSYNTLFWVTSFLINPLISGVPSCARKKNGLENPVRLYAPFHIFFCRLIVHTHIDPVQLWVLCGGTSFPQFLHLFSVSKLNNLFAFYLNPLASRVSGGNDMWRLLWSCHPCAE